MGQDPTASLGRGSSSRAKGALPDVRAPRSSTLLVRPAGFPGIGTLGLNCRPLFLPTLREPSGVRPSRAARDPTSAVSALEFLSGHRLEVRLEHPLDPRARDAAVESRDDPSPLHEDERRHLLDPESLRDLGPQVDVDAPEAQTLALLACQVREEALHPPRRARAIGVEEDEQGPGLVVHRIFVFPPEMRRKRSAGSRV